jgi:short subunit dehydrogenase-like uncharacterized protein
MFDALSARAKTPSTFLARVSSSGPSSLAACALLCALFPVLLAVTLLAAAAAVVYGNIRKCCLGKAQRQPVNLLDGLPSSGPKGPTHGPTDEGEQLDVIVLGATGLVGGHILSYLTTRHPNLRVGIAGRTHAKLAAVRAQKGEPHQRIIVADAADVRALFAMCAQTRVLLTTVGPFKRYGNLVYHACAHSGTHYVDITGESDWVSRMGAIYNAVAVRSGASMVSFGGVDSVPSDVGTFLACEKFRNEHPRAGPVRGVEVVVTRFKGGAPAGTIETVAGAVDGTDRLQLPVGGKAALQALPAMPRNADTNIVDLFKPFARAVHLKYWTVPFFMGHTNSRTVRRTNAILGHAPDLRYSERMGFASFTQALTYLLGACVALPWIYFAPLREILRRVGALPKANAGASAVSEEICVRGSVSFSFAAYGEDSRGNTVISTVRFSGMGDPGVAHTAVCQSEIAVLLASREIDPRPGCVTPVAAVGAERLKEALVGTGLVWVDAPPAHCCVRTLSEGKKIS